MEKYAILLGYFDKQTLFVNRLHADIVEIDVTSYKDRFVFALKVQQLYTAIEDLLKQIAKSFENHIESFSQFHKELLSRMNTDIPQIRPAVISSPTFLLLDKLRAFRHFIRHAYDCELDPQELQLIQKKLQQEFAHLHSDLDTFRTFVEQLAQD